MRTLVGQDRPEAAPGPVLRLCWLVLLLELPLAEAAAVWGAAIEADGGADFFGLGMNSCWPMLSLFGSLMLLAATMSLVFTSYIVAMSPRV